MGPVLVAVVSRLASFSRSRRAPQLEVLALRHSTGSSHVSPSRSTGPVPRVHPSRVALLDAIAEVAVDAILRQAEAYGDQLPVPLVVEEVVADKGYHAAATLAACAAVGLRT